MDKIMAVIKEIKRVLRSDGQFWLNFGDCYGGVKVGKTDQKVSDYVKDVQRGIKKDLPEMEKCLMMMPERIALAMIDDGWILRNKIKWAKQILIKKENRTMGSVMPTSVKDRFNESGEELYFFVKNKKYWSDLDAVRLPNQVLGVTDFREDTHHLGSGFVRTPELYPNSKYRDKNYRGKFADNKNAESFNSPRARTQRKSLKARMKDTKQKNSKESRSYNMKKLLSEVRLGIKPNTGIVPKYNISKRQNELVKGGVISSAQRIRGFFDEYGGENNPAGKNLPTIWLIGSEPHNFQKELQLDIETDHFSIFPQALVEIPIKFGCPKGGIVLDPFGGSMTTAVVAKKLKRKYIMIELNKDYCKIGRARIRSQAVPLL